MADEVLRERRRRVEILTINRPEARNAINAAVTAAMSDALDELTDDAAVSVVVLTGTGDKAFSAGMDLKAFAARAPGASGAHGGFAGVARRDFPKPLIAAVNGAALAGGLEIVLSCDLVVAAKHAVFGIPEVKRGLVAAAGGIVRLPQRLPLAIALELGLTGDPIDAERAYTLGLVNKVVPLERLIDEAVALAERVAANAPLALKYSKEVMHRAASASEDEAWALSDAAGAVMSASADSREGATAFVERRAPNWLGR